MANFNASAERGYTPGMRHFADKWHQHVVLAVTLVACLLAGMLACWHAVVYVMRMGGAADGC
jgi:hypothetical protein